VRKRTLLVIGIGVLVIAAGGSVAVVASAGSSTPLPATTTVTRSNLAETVSASGNVVSGTTSELAMPGVGGIVTKVWVTTGQSVSQGDSLVTVDDTAARQQLDAAQAGLAAAEAALATANQGRTSAEKTADNAAIAVAQQNLTNAERALSGAEARRKQVVAQQAELVAAAAATLSALEDSLAADRTTLADLQAELAATTDPTEVANLTADITEVQSRMAATQAAIPGAQANLAAAKRTRDTAVLEADQAVTAQQGTRDAAAKALAQQKAAAAVAQQGPRDGTVAAAAAQVDAARVAVDQAETAVANTVLRAPFDGVISTVSAVVGQPSTGSASTTGGSHSGLVTLVDSSSLSVEAMIAEADATSVELGQTATVELPASAETFNGTVVSIDPASTVIDNVVLYKAVISLPVDADSIRTGQTATVTITTRTATGVLSLPSSAIGTTDGAAWVLLVSGASRTQVAVTTGLVTTTRVEVLTGVAEGDVVQLDATQTSKAKR